MTAFALLIATPLGIFAAIWLVEYARRGSKLVKVVRVTTETLQGIPSIVYGLFGMLFFVTQLHWGYSMIAGAFTLAIMVLPVIMRTTEEALIAVPDSYREGSFGLGAGKLRTVFTIVLPSAMPGILSGVILATGRIVGETAALIYTASSVAKIPTSVFSSTRTLAVHMYLLSNEGSTSARPTAPRGAAGAGAGHQLPVRLCGRQAGEEVKLPAGRRGRRPPTYTAACRAGHARPSADPLPLCFRKAEGRTCPAPTARQRHICGL